MLLWCVHLTALIDVEMRFKTLFNYVTAFGPQECELHFFSLRQTYKFMHGFGNIISQ